MSFGTLTARGAFVPYIPNNPGPPPGAMRDSEYGFPRIPYDGN
jgi:hypothetical protein